jgi:hypothetical protein
MDVPIRPTPSMRTIITKRFEKLKYNRMQDAN